MQPMTRPCAARVVPIPAAGLPGWCDRFMTPAGKGEFFASRVWYETLLGGALPVGSEPCLAMCGETGPVVLPLMRGSGRLSALVAPYTLDWRPLLAADATPETLRAAGHSLGMMFRRGPPVRLDTLDPALPGLDPLLQGFASAGMRALRFAHTGNWHETLPRGTSWADYLAARPSVLRTTVTRKLARAAREAEFELVAGPGPRLDAGIAAYEWVRARSWKPSEPFPDFDATLMRAVAGLGLLRLGILRSRSDGKPLAAQYWLLDRDGQRATVLKLAHIEESRGASPGTVLTAQMIRGLLEQDGVTELDLGRGDDPYKRLWAGLRRQRIGVVLASPLQVAGALEILRYTLGALRRRLARNRWVQS